MMLGGRFMRKKTEAVAREIYKKEAEIVRKWLSELEKGEILEAVNRGQFDVFTDRPEVLSETFRKVVKKHGYEVVYLSGRSCSLCWKKRELF